MKSYYYYMSVTYTRQQITANMLAHFFFSFIFSFCNFVQFFCLLANVLYSSVQCCQAYWYNSLLFQIYKSIQRQLITNDFRTIKNIKSLIRIPQAHPLNTSVKHWSNEYQPHRCTKPGSTVFNTEQKARDWGIIQLLVFTFSTLTRRSYFKRAKSQIYMFTITKHPIP